MEPPLPAPPQRTSKLAITALVLSCLLCLPLVPLLGAALGVVALIRISGRPELGGRGLAILSIPLGLVSVAVAGVLAAIAIPNFIRFQERAIESEARAVIAQIAMSQEEHYRAHGTFLPAGPTPAAIPEGPVEATFDGPWETLGVGVYHPVRFQYEARVEGDGGEAPAVRVRARAHRHGSEIVWQIRVTPEGRGAPERHPPD
jgi:hypothetical protein